MFWPEKIAEEIIKSGKHKPYWVDDMKTPSGRIHVGALRGVIIHDLIYRAFLKKGKKAQFSYVINDMDPMDGFPHYLDKSFKKYMGIPLYKIPSPEKGFKSLAHCYGSQFIDVFNMLNAKPKIIWSSEWYKKGKFDSVIREALDKVEKVRELYKKVSNYDKPKDWYPFQVICPKCGKVGTTLVTFWDGEKVSFECRKNLVSWAKGCGYKGKISPFSGTGKLMWKVDWAAHWKVIGVTIEWAGKDHMSEGGSYDLSSAICEKVFNYPKPQAKLYEWFLAKGGTKMSSSKGVGTTALEISKTLPPELLRFLLVKTHFKKAIIFEPSKNQSILNLFDDYDKYADHYFSKKESDYGKIWELSQVGPFPKVKPFYPRFRDVVNFFQSSSVNLEKKFEEIKGSKLNKEELQILKRRIKYANIWLKNYASKELSFKIRKDIPKEANDLSLEQKKYLQALIKLIEKKDWQADKLQQAIYDLSKEEAIKAGQAFQAIYLSLIGKTHGPKAAWLILDNDKDFVVKRFKEVIQ